MAISLVQSCDRCGTERALVSESQANNGGWREFRGRHICAECIVVILGCIDAGPNTVLHIPEDEVRKEEANVAEPPTV